MDELHVPGIAAGAPRFYGLPLSQGTGTLDWRFVG